MISLMRVAVLVVAGLMLAAAGEPQTVETPISNPQALAPFFEAQAGDGPLRILHIGDSHIARDTFSGDLRSLLGDERGAGGRGMLPPGTVYAFFQARGVELDMSEGWEIFRARDEEASGPFGVMSARVTARAGTSPWIALSGIEPAAERLLIGYMRHPDGGVVQVRVDAALHAIPTNRAAGPAFAALAIPEGTQIIRLAAAGDGDVTLTSLVLEADRDGVTLSNAGWPGATAEIMARWDDTVLRTELGRLEPHLIIVGYGTNEGFDDALDLAAYEAVLRDQLLRLKRFAPGAALLLTGGPDGTRLPLYADTESREPDEWACAQLSDDERAEYQSLLEAKSTGLLRWHAPPQFDALLALQKRVAVDAGAAHWDWRAAMGGACSIHDWRLAEPQWAKPDHVHLTAEGYAASAAVLRKALNGAFVAWDTVR